MDENGNNWHDENGILHSPLGPHPDVPPVYTVFDGKHNGCHKGCCVADGHLTDTPVGSVYSGVDHCHTNVLSVQTVWESGEETDEQEEKLPAKIKLNLQHKEIQTSMKTHPSNCFDAIYGIIDHEISNKRIGQYCAVSPSKNGDCLCIYLEYVQVLEQSTSIHSTTQLWDYGNKISDFFVLLGGEQSIKKK